MSIFKVRDISEYNKKISKKYTMPYIVVIIDEFADLMMHASKKMESIIIKISQKSRASGIHLVIATQRPSAKIITGLIKSNIPSRISFKVLSKIDSKIILDHPGAENLLGKGDMLYLSYESNKIKRLQSGIYLGK